ncbi:hypothetical protein OG223_45260 [Streptomyces sp. NBC_01478]|uniref:hypothetical protein n=1 Tax=Streptomyces sp. NBC_01478 TaxID=2903882 RepID=UPI002E2F4F19|nr:hypothetical protein [Streptomyces sp. NBC_01478]
MEDSRRELAEALAGSDAADPTAAPQVLGHAFRWATAALRGLDGGARGQDALAVFFALDLALEEGRELADALPGLLAAARPGEQNADRTTELARRLTETADRVRAERETLEKLTAAEEALRARLAEHEELRRQVDELRRLERLVVALDGLRNQQQVIQERLVELRGRDAGVDEALRTSSDALVRLTEDQLAVLAPQTRQTLERAATAQSALAAAEREYRASSAELAACHDRLERIRTERGGQLASLTRHAQADRELARALREAAGPAGTPASPAAETATLAEVAATTESIERRLREADEALGRVLDQRAERNTDGRAMVGRTSP